MSTRAHPHYRSTLADRVEERLEVVPYADDRAKALSLDSHQQDAMLEIYAALYDDNRRQAFSIVHCCGSGKTLLEANIVGASQDAKADLGIAEDRRDIVLTTERSLINVIREQFEALGLNDVGVWGNGEKVLDRPIVLSTIQAMQMNRKKLKKLLPLDRIDLVVGDEADNYLTKGRRKVVETLDGALRIGLTATPMWRDGRHISDLWGPKIHQLSLKEGIQRGINTPPVWKLYEAAIDANNLRIRTDDYEPKTLAAAMKHAEIHRSVAEIYRTVVEKHKRHLFPTLIFVPSTYLVRMVTETFRKEFGQEGLQVQGWTGEDTKGEQLKEDTIAFRDGKLHVLVLCEMGGRGLDLPSARLLIDAYPTLSPTKLEQRHGRVLRKVREGSPLYQSGFRKEYSVIIQVHPKSNSFRPICLPDILDGWDEAEKGKPLGLGRGDVGAAWLEEVEELQKRIEKKRPAIDVTLVEELNLYRKLNRFDDLPQADEHGFFYLPKNHGEKQSET